MNYLYPSFHLIEYGTQKSAHGDHGAPAQDHKKLVVDFGQRLGQKEGLLTV